MSNRVIFANEYLSLTAPKISLMTDTTEGNGVFINGQLYNPSLTSETKDTIMLGEEEKTYKAAWIGGVDVIALYHRIGELEDKLAHVIAYFEQINPTV